MSKGKGGKFENRAARKFSDMAKVDTMEQSEIYDCLLREVPGDPDGKSELKVILDQVTAARKKQGPYPTYVANMFANLSTALFFREFVAEHVDVEKRKKRVVVKFRDLDADEAESLRSIIADAYKKSVKGFYAEQSQELIERNELLSKTFVKLCAEENRIAEKLGLEDAQRRDLVVQVYGDPIHNIRYVQRAFDASMVSDEKKLKIFRELYGRRFKRAVGAALTIEKNDSDLVAHLYEFVSGRKSKKKRAKYLMEYARAYKHNKTRYPRMASDQAFYEDNKPVIKELKRYDVGFKKAFRNFGKKPATGRPGGGTSPRR